MSGIKILVIDDETAVRKLLIDFFSKKGCETVSVASGRLGLNLLARERFDCLISDVNNLEFVQGAKNLYPSLAVLLLMGGDSLEGRREEVAIMPFDCFSKPIDLKKLYSAVMEGIRREEETAERMNWCSVMFEEKMQEDKIRFDSLRQELVELISHELRTPIAIISESFNLLKDRLIVNHPDNIKALSEEDKDKLIRAFETGRRRIVGIIDEVNYYMDLNRGKVGVQKSEVILNNFLENSFEGFERLIRGTAAKFRKEFASQKQLVCIDKDKFLDVLVRLVNNAVVHNSGDIEVLLKLSSAKEGRMNGETTKFTEVAVCDNGKGIERDIMDNIFKPFNVGRMSHHCKGIGLGLSICKRIIEVNGGVISLESEENKGTNVIIQIPVIGA
jgi:signal transduction histidine kinase